MISYLSPSKEPAVITVGSVHSDIIGCDSAAIQNAVDLVKVHGGGIVRIGEGIFDISAPVRLPDNIILKGTGDKTVLRKTAGVKAGFAEDADYGELKVTVDSPGLFKKGMGIQLYDECYSDHWAVTTAVITAIDEDILYLDSFLLRDYSADAGGFISNSCSLIEGIGISNVTVSSLVIDGNGAANNFLNGCRGGGLYFHRAANCLVEDVKVVNFNGDGISWQTTEDITIRNCEVSGCHNYGLHPGTGSLRSVVEDCMIHDNGSDGLFVCWRVKYGSFLRNMIFSNKQNGINIGHKDTDNCFKENFIFGNGSNGIYMREEKRGNTADRNRFEGNRIEDNGNMDNGAGILIDSIASDIVIIGNIIRDTGKKVQKNGIVARAAVTGLIQQDNKMSGHSGEDLVGL